MAEPSGPNTPDSPGGGNGERPRIDRDMTPLGSQQKMNYGAFGVIVGLALLFVLWWTGAFSTQEPETKENPQPLQIQPAPPVPPSAIPQRAAPLRAPEPFPTPGPLPWFLIPLLLLTAIAVGFMHPSPSRVALLALLLFGGVLFHYEFSPQAAALRDYRAWWDVLTTEERRCLASRHRARQFMLRNGEVEPCVFNEQPWLL